MDKDSQIRIFVPLITPHKLFKYSPKIGGLGQGLTYVTCGMAYV